MSNRPKAFTISQIQAIPELIQLAKDLRSYVKGLELEPSERLLQLNDQAYAALLEAYEGNIPSDSPLYERQKRWRKANPEKYKASRNPYMAEYMRKRRAKQKQS